MSEFLQTELIGVRPVDQVFDASNHKLDVKNAPEHVTAKHLAKSQVQSMADYIKELEAQLEAARAAAGAPADTEETPQGESKDGAKPGDKDKKPAEKAKGEK